MTVRTIPVRGDLPDHSMTMTLDNVLWTLRFRWNARDGAWYMDLSDGTGNPLKMGRKVLVDQLLFARFRDFALPPGDFVAVDTLGEHTDPRTQQDFGARYQLLYFEAADIPAAFRA